MNRVRDKFLYHTSPNHTGALESFGKSRYKECLPEIVPLADEDGSDIKR